MPKQPCTKNVILTVVWWVDFKSLDSAVFQWQFGTKLEKLLFREEVLEKKWKSLSWSPDPWTPGWGYGIGNGGHILSVWFQKNQNWKIHFPMQRDFLLDVKYCNAKTGCPFCFVFIFNLFCVSLVHICIVFFPILCLTLIYNNFYIYLNKLIVT